MNTPNDEGPADMPMSSDMGDAEATPCEKKGDEPTMSSRPCPPPGDAVHSVDEELIDQFKRSWSQAWTTACNRMLGSVKRELRRVAKTLANTLI